MACRIEKKDRAEHAQLITLAAIAAVAELVDPTTLTLDTSLGKWGLGHTPVKRKLYHEAVRIRLAEFGCVMRTLKETDFSDLKKKTVADIAEMVRQDLA